MWSLESKPMRRADAQMLPTATGALIELPVHARWPFRLPAGAKRRFELDEIGLLVWRNCDGQTTLLTLIGKLAEQYRLNLREAQAATLQFIQTLAARRLITLEKS